MADIRSQRPAFGALLRQRRIDADLTQELLAERARISVQAVSALERGVRGAPRADTFVLLTEALGLRDDALREFEAAARSSAKLKVRSTQALSGTSLPEHVSQLPRFDTLFVGRENEARELQSAVGPGACVTLWGTGGVGKTRLAVEMAAKIGESFERTVFVPLASTIHDEAVEDTVAEALGVVRVPGQALFDRLVSDLVGSRCLLIIDNCEHVIAGAARLTDALLAAIPNVAIVSTSREPLRIGGERVVVVGALSPSDAQRLFVSRAATAGDTRVASDSDVRSVETICRRLDGIPLALELAAACARAIDLQHIARGLDERFRLLTRGSRAAGERHLTLRATIAWSYDLLEQSERLVFEAAAIVNGSFSLEDLLALAVDRELTEASIVAAVAPLVDKSLILVETSPQSGTRRYRLLESTRAFALQLSKEAGDVRSDHAQDRFGRYLLGRLLAVNAAYRQGDRSGAREIDFDNIRGYLDWAIDQRHDVAMGANVAGELHIVCDVRGLQLEGIGLIEAGLARLVDGEDNDLEIMIASFGAARLYQRLSLFTESLKLAYRAYELAKSHRNDAIHAAAASALGLAYEATDEEEKVHAYALEAAAVYDRLGDHSGAAFARCTASLIVFKMRRDEPSLEAARQAVEILRPIGSRGRSASAAMTLAEAEFAWGAIDSAIVTIRQAIGEMREVSSQLDLGLALTNLLAYLCCSNRMDDVAESAFESFEIGRAGNYRRVVVLAVQACAIVAASNGRDTVRAAELLGYVSRGYESIGVIGFTEAYVHARLRSLVVGLLEPAELTAATKRGERLDDESAIDVSLECLE